MTYTRGLDLSGSLKGAGGIGGLLAFSTHSSQTTSHYFYHTDSGGNITALLDSNQNLVGRYIYDPYGNMLGMSGGMADVNTYRFSSKEFDSKTGLYYYGFRFFDSNLQRWLNQDPLGERGGINLYQFVSNDPVNGVDPLGLDAFFYGAFDPIPQESQDVQLAAAEGFLEGLRDGFRNQNPQPSWGGPFGPEHPMLGGTPPAPPRLFAPLEKLLGKLLAKLPKWPKKVPCPPNATGAAQLDDAISAATPVGRRGQQATYPNPGAPRPRNAPGTINGRDFSGHAFDRMQERGFTPTTVENAIQNGILTPGATPSTFQYFDPVNKFTVITDATSGGVITVF